MDRLEMTFVPQLPGDGKCFVWLTDGRGKPRPQKNNNLYFHLLDRPEWREVFDNEQPNQTTLTIRSDERSDHITGLCLSMTAIQRLLTNHWFHDSLTRQFRYGESFNYFDNMLHSIQPMLAEGHFFPMITHFGPDHHLHYFSHWLLDHRILTESRVQQEWLKGMPQQVLTPALLEPLTLNQWLYLVIDTFAHQLINQSLGTSNPMQGQNQQDAYSRWLNALMSTDDQTLATTDTKDDQSSLARLEATVNEHSKSFLTGANLQALKHLKTFKEKHFEAVIQPEVIEWRLEPDDDQEPFSGHTEWALDVKVTGTQDGESGTYDLDTFLSNHPDHSIWFMNAIQPIKDRHPSLYMELSQFKSLCFFSTDRVLRLNADKDDLAQAGIQLKFPSWMKLSKLKQPVQLDLNIDTDVSHFDLSTIVDFDWRISLGDADMSYDEFQQLMERQQQIIKSGDEWIELPLEAVQKAYETLKQVEGKQSQTTGWDALRATSLQGDDTDVQFNIHTPEKMNDYLQSLTELKGKTYQKPRNFYGDLRPYQKKGYQWLVHLYDKKIGGCLADDMGLGKTIQTITYLLKTIKRGEPALIICPTSLIRNWANELHTFAPSLSVSIHHGPERMGPDSFAKEGPQYNVILTSYSLIAKDIATFKAMGWNNIIIDEAQTIKNPSAKKTQAIRQLEGKHRLALTGTPIENKLEELWSIMQFLNPGYFGSLTDFREQFITPIEKHQNDVKTTVLQKLIHPFILRRKKTDRRIIKDLPDKGEHKMTCHLAPQQASLYQKTVENLMEQIEETAGMKRRGLILTSLNRLKQICNHPALVQTDAQPDLISSGKLSAFFNILDPLMAEDENVLVFTQYVRMGHMIQSTIEHQYPDAQVAFFHGQLNAKKRQTVVDHFQDPSTQKKVLILSLRAGGLGLNLTEANHVIHFDRWWNPAVEEQATDRSYRIGQYKNVEVYKLICEGTLEKRIDELIDSKKALTENILGQGDQWLTEMNDQEIYELVQLREKVDL
ncbi:DEAD/DEAH box helicase [Tuberibacillus sp. Marseille-P3662]|uniref:DEAD/DEAH box helicase n=1 Tax=Tuberibacillus sp. Marseille-P3662 TaxID=1965358 RepID=UPI0015944C33|nr:DEAD/DEAH box helicase [Tuberibacillus sp. Marseille-P3662]